jgi:septal ring factor EnvC (AmiA/AmiB activator)
MINPLALLEKAINEHGSSVILRERLALAAEQFAVLEQKLADANALLSQQSVTISQLQSNDQRLHTELEQAQVKIRDLEKQLTKSHDGPLDDVKERIVAILAEQARTTEDLARMTGLSEVAIAFHLEHERMRTLAEQADLGYCISVALTPEGRQYAAQRGLLRIK